MIFPIIRLEFNLINIFIWSREFFTIFYKTHAESFTLSKGFWEQAEFNILSLIK